VALGLRRPVGVVGGRAAGRFADVASQAFAAVRSCDGSGDCSGDVGAGCILASQEFDYLELQVLVRLLRRHVLGLAADRKPFDLVLGGLGHEGQAGKHIANASVQPDAAGRRGPDGQRPEGQTPDEQSCRATESEASPSWP
jgi:hypothetical protein